VVADNGIHPGQLSARLQPNIGSAMIVGLGITVAPSTVWEILNGIDPAPRCNGPSWTQFLRFQAEAIIACDLFTVDLLDGTKAYVMAVVEHATRRIDILTSSGGAAMGRQAAVSCMATARCRTARSCSASRAATKVKVPLRSRPALATGRRSP